MKKTVVLVLAFFCFLTLAACKPGGDGTSAAKEKTVTISTPFVDLKVSENFDANVSHEVVNENPYTLLYRAKKGKAELFSLIFNGSGEALLGTVVGDKENTAIYINMPELDKDSEYYEENCIYQEGVNDILDGLMADYNFSVKEAAANEDNSTFDIPTSVVTLKYPAKWKEKVQITVLKDGVQFSNNDTRLFDLMFTECDGYRLGTYKDIPIYVVDYMTENDEQAVMQEDVNVILQYLMKDPDFVVGS